MPRSSKAPSHRSSAVICICILNAIAHAGCSATPTPVVADDAPRRPDGVAIDRPFAPPPTTAEADANAGVVTLSTPLSTDVARSIVQKFFGAVFTEDRTALQAVLSPGARDYNPSTGYEEDASYYWSRRFETFDYTTLSQSSVFRRDSVEVFRVDQWARASQGALRPTDADPNDVVARVRLPPATSGRPVFGDSIAFQLRRVGSSYMIVRLMEDFSFQ